MKRTIPFLALVCLLPAISGCASLGPRSLKADQVDYGRALGEAKKREILSMIVGLRYADAPAFLNVTQIIAAYTFEATGGAALNTQPDPGGPAAGATGTLSYSNHPTFTFTPTTGEDYARAYIHPLAPELILPLADSGIPVDLLLRITVQSIGNLRNASMLGGTAGNGTPEFFELLQVLRRLQLGGELRLEYTSAPPNAGRVKMSLGAGPGAGSDPEEADVERARSLLELPKASGGYEIVSGDAPAGAGTLAVGTRSVLAILSDLGAQIAVPDADVANGATKPSIGLVGGETRPVIVVHTGGKAPGDAYACVSYRASKFWIDAADFDSKYALLVVQDIMDLAEVTETAHAPIVTVPAN